MRKLFPGTARQSITEWGLEVRLIKNQRNVSLESCVWLYTVPNAGGSKSHNEVYLHALFSSILQQLITGKMSHLGCLTITYDTIEQPVLLIQGICANLGLEMGINLHLAINCAAHELMDYVSFHSRTCALC